MNQSSTLHRSVVVLTSFCLVVFLTTGCSSKKTITQNISGGRSAVISIDPLIKISSRPKTVRKSALLGLFVAEYLSTSPAAMAAESGRKGVDVQSQIATQQTSITDPDFDLMQAFADALEVDVSDLLNRSVDRQQALDVYSESLTNVATRANDRYKELKSVVDQLKQASRQQNQDLTVAQRNLKKAIDAKDFANAAELQKTVMAAQDTYSQTDLKQRETQQLVDTFDKLLTLYGQKILAMQQNREVLIAGNKVVDVPGIEDLQIIQRIKNPARPSGTTASAFDSLFQSSSSN